MFCSKSSDNRSSVYCNYGNLSVVNLRLTAYNQGISRINPCGVHAVIRCCHLETVGILAVLGRAGVFCLWGCFVCMGLVLRQFLQCRISFCCALVIVWKSVFRFFQHFCSWLWCAVHSRSPFLPDVCCQPMALDIPFLSFEMLFVTFSIGAFFSCNGTNISTSWAEVSIRTITAGSGGCCSRINKR